MSDTEETDPQAVTTVIVPVAFKEVQPVPVSGIV